MADETQVVSQPTAGDAGQTPASSRNAGDVQGSVPADEREHIIRELRDENAKRRVENQELKKRLTELAAVLSPDEKPARADDALKTITETVNGLMNSLKELDERADRQARYHALREESIRAGAIDLDAALKLIDPAAVTVDPSGVVVGASEAIARLAEAKPYLFAKAPMPPNPGATNPAQGRDDSISAIQKRVREKLSNPFDDLDSFGRGGGLVLPWEG